MNTTKPGLPDYTGPSDGWFAYIHHEQQLEWSHNIQERVAYILANKPAHEQAIRLACLTHIPIERVPVAYDTAGQAYDTAEQAYDTAEQAYVTAEQAYNTSRQAYYTSRQAYYTAEQAYNTARQAYDTPLTALVAELVPDAPWDGTQLIFPNPQEAS